MPHEPQHMHGAMEAKGAYNRYARLQHAGAALALPYLEQAARDLALEAGAEPIVVVDYGSSQGKNSLLPMQTAIHVLRARVGRERSIIVYHVDLPANDFNTLFAVLDSDSDRYAQGDRGVFPCAIGRSFYEQVLPAEYAHLAWSSYAAVWLSHIPMPIPDHFEIGFATADVRAAFDRQGRQDWEAFLALRARELRPGGRLVVVLPANNDDGASGFEDLFNHANAVLAAMVAQGSLLADERARMVLGAYRRRRQDLLAPFRKEGQFQRLVVESCDLVELPDAAWAEYARDGDADALANAHARFFRATFMPTLALGLRNAGDPDAYRAFGDRLEDGLKRRLASQPAPVHTFVQTMVMSKQGANTTPMSK